MAEEKSFKKEVTTKKDGRYLIYYDFTPEPSEQATKQQNSEERK